ncbi:helix-turn-helix domain-containing protein [Sporolactobacillus putidus]|uniref:XRE family transcriptional regulator n=1 Tax=Sporolactobacillus putidus TaxID=492735 RepID=A0A917RXS0_9BACL|nr:RodZ domain-containing protein [Sporolactobacillus putidus]GGL43680.1 XRE family transcriptional regulator [Sporolactobacillus putidus]
MSELGQTLKEAREAKGLSLDDLQEETKIQKRYLQAIEDGDFKQLPGDFYTRAFIKSYAESVGLDFGELSAQNAGELPKMYREHTEIRTLPPDGSEEMPASRTVRRRTTRSGTDGWSSFLSKAIIAVFVLIAIMIVYILVTNLMSGHPNQTPKNGQGSASSVSFKGSSASAASSGSSSAKSGSSAQKNSSSSSSMQQSLKMDSTQGSTTTYTLSGTTKFAVSISATNGNSSWISATDVKSGNQLVQGIASGSKTFNFDASNVQSLRIDIGNVPNTVLKINGQDFTFPNQTIVQTIVINFTK